MYGNLKTHLQNEIESIKAQGLFKKERIITSAQGAEITLSSGETVLNFCSNNYLGLSNHPEVIEAAKNIMDSHGFGMSSVRFICGTQDIHCCSIKIEIWNIFRSIFTKPWRRRIVYIWTSCC